MKTVDIGCIEREVRDALGKGKIKRAIRALWKMEQLLPSPRVYMSHKKVCAASIMPYRFTERWGWTVGIGRAAWLSQAWFMAVTRRDFDSLCLLVAVVNVSWKNPMRTPKQRCLILMIKDILDARSELQEVPARLELAKLAALIGYPQTCDGYAALRRLAKQLDFPIAAGQRGNPHRR